METRAQRNVHFPSFPGRRFVVALYLLPGIALPVGILLTLVLSGRAGGGSLKTAILLLLAGALAIFAIARTGKALRTLKEFTRTYQRLQDSYDQYILLVRNELQKLNEGDFITSEESKTEAQVQEKVAECEDVRRILRETADKIKMLNVQNQRISFELGKSIQALVETGAVQASGSSEQASSIAQITATMEELARTAAQIAENSNRVAQLASNSDHASKEGYELIQAIIDSIKQLDEKMIQISQKTQVLGSQSKQIGKVLDIISAIANETHLLSLNAAIESVAAGEFGKRFGVVAAEVRRLAEISRQNAEAIKGNIEQFQNAIDTTILAIEEGSRMTSQANRSAQEIITNLNHIIQAVTQTSQSASEISIATQQQRSASDQIVLTLKDISQVTKQQAQELKKSARELEKLNNLALNMQLLAQQAILDSPLSLGFNCQKWANLTELSSSDRRLQQQALARIAEENPYLEFVYATDQEGKLLCYQIGKQGGELPENLYIGIDFSSRPWYIQAKNSTHPFISDVYKSLFSKEDHFTVAVSIFNDKREFHGVLGADINVRSWNRMING